MLEQRLDGFGHILLVHAVQLCEVLDGDVERQPSGAHGGQVRLDVRDRAEARELVHVDVRLNRQLTAVRLGDALRGVVDHAVQQLQQRVAFGAPDVPFGNTDVQDAGAGEDALQVQFLAGVRGGGALQGGVAEQPQLVGQAGDDSGDHVRAQLEDVRRLAFHVLVMVLGDVVPDRVCAAFEDLDHRRHGGVLLGHHAVDQPGGQGPLLVLIEVAGAGLHALRAERLGDLLGAGHVVHAFEHVQGHGVRAERQEELHVPPEAVVGLHHLDQRVVRVLQIEDDGRLAVHGVREE